MRVVLVTGGTGFIGSRLVTRLVEDGFQTHVLARVSSDISQLAPSESEIRIHRYDGTYASLLSIMEKVKPETIFHLAAQVQFNHSVSDIEPLIHSNVVFGTQLIEAAVANGCTTVVNTCTFWQHYQNKDYSPVCLYAATKQAFESILQYYIETTPLRAISLVLGDTYGPGDPRGKIISLLGNAANQKSVLPLSPGNQLIDLVYIDDVTSAYLIANQHTRALPPSSYRRYAISSGAQLTLKQLVAIYEEVIGIEIPVQWGGRTYREREMMLPTDRNEILPGWKTEVALPEGIRKTYASL